MHVGTVIYALKFCLLKKIIILSEKQIHDIHVTGVL